jgi:LacI family transcriptional regulator
MINNRKQIADRTDITILDIARKLHIAPSTVSKALNYSPLINDKTGSKVRDVAERMGYRVNLSAQSLRTGKTNLIGLIIPTILDQKNTELITGIENMVTRCGYNLILRQSLGQLKNEITCADDLFSSNVDGLITSFLSGNPYLQHIQQFIDRSIPVISLDSFLIHPGAINIKVNHIKATYDGISHLIQRGCRKIALIITKSDLEETNAAYIAGYKAAMEAGKIPASAYQVYRYDDLEEAIAKSVKDIFESEILPEGLLFTDELCAVNCMQEIKRKGLNVPGDIAFVTLGNSELLERIEPELTAVDYRYQELGNMLAGHMISVLRDKTEHYHTTTTAPMPTLILRQSS